MQGMKGNGESKDTSAKVRETWRKVAFEDSLYLCTQIKEKTEKPK
jgi:hypothetical protein